MDDRLPSSSSFNLLPWKYAAASATRDQRKSFELPKPSTVVQEQQQLHPIPPAPLKSGMIRSSSKVAEFCRTRKQTLAQDTTAAASCKTKKMLMKDAAAAAAVEGATTLSSLDADIKHVNEVSLILSEAHGSLINNSSLAQALPCPPGVNRSVVDVTGSSCSGRQEAAEHEVKKSTTTQHDDSTNNFFLESSAIQNMGDNILSGNPTHCTQLLPIQLQKSSSTSSDYRSHSHRKALANSLLFDESQYNSFDANSLSKNHHELVGGSMRVVRDFNSYDGAQLEFIISDHPTAGPPTSLPTSPRRRRAGSGIRTSSSWLQRLRLVAGGKQQGSASSSSSHREGIGQTVIGSNNSNSGKQDATTTPVVVVAAAAAAEERFDLRHGKKKEVSNSAPKAAHDCVTTDESTIVDDDLVHQQHEAGDRNNVENAEGNHEEDAEGNHEEEHHSFQTHEEQCCSTTSDPTKDFVAKSPEQQKLNHSSWPFSKWKWSSRSHSKVVSEEEVENGNNDNMVKEVNFVVDCKSGGGGGESKLVKRTKMRSLSMECLETEEEMQMPPTLLLGSEQNNLTIEEVVALSSSPLKFMFKCREIQHFNKFLRLQKKRLTSSLQQQDQDQEEEEQQQHPAENTDCFHIIRSGTQCGTNYQFFFLPLIFHILLSCHCFPIQRISSIVASSYIG